MTQNRTILPLCYQFVKLKFFWHNLTECATKRHNLTECATEEAQSRMNVLQHVRRVE